LKEGDERPGLRREIAAIYARQGARDQAYEWFARAVDSGWRMEAVFPSPLFEEIRRDAPFLRSMSRMQTEIQRDGEHVIREPINAPIR
jgi:hypothetical protein